MAIDTTYLDSDTDSIMLARPALLEMAKKVNQTVSVLDFGADPTGVADSTAAFNLATMATTPHTGNADLAMRREIIVPVGDYKIQGTVYVRKGQMLRGAGDGGTRITAGTQTSSGRIMFNLGNGLISSVVTPDPGGLPPVIEKLHIYGGDSIGAVVDTQAAGAQIRDLFITSSGVAIKAWGGDILISRLFVDQSLGGIVLSGQNNVVHGCLFYQSNYGITLASNAFDIQIADCHFEYSAYNDILFATGATNIKNVSIANCQFVKNAQYVTSDSAIGLRSAGAEINIRGCDFRNQRSYSILGTSAATGSKVRIHDCTFNGLKTVTGYTQSTTAAGINAQNADFEITNCRFENLLGAPINVPGSVANAVIVRDCLFTSTTGVASHIVMSGSAGLVEMYNNRGDNVLPLFNMQSGIPFLAKGNVRWLAAAQTSGGRRYWLIPTDRGSIVQVGIRANSLPANSLYRHVGSFYAVRKIETAGSGTLDYATEIVLHATPSAGTAPALDIVVEFDSVGAGATLGYVNSGRNLLVSIPDTYTNSFIEADYVI